MDERYANVLEETKKEFSDFKLSPKSESRLMKAINTFLLIISFGKNKTFMDGFITTIGETVYTPSSWDAFPDIVKAVVIRHERMHMRQEKRYTLPLYYALYILIFFPIGLAYGRAKLEMEAYAEGMLAKAEFNGLDSIRTPKYKEWIVSQFTTSQYIWMWPFPKTVGGWFDKALKEIEGKLGKKA